MSHGSKVIIQQTPAQEINKGVDFNKGLFETAIQQKGYDVHHEKAIKCPCRTKDNDNLSTCQNCGGSGWLFINKTRTKMILRSMDISTKYTMWSPENPGKVLITARDIDKLAWMDRITVLNGESINSQLLYYTATFKGILAAFTIYDIQEIYDIFLFVGDNQKLRLLSLGEDYAFEGNKVILTKKYHSYKFPLTISIRYLHFPQFHVVDITRDIMSTYADNDNSGQKENTKLPIAAVGKRSHYLFDRDKFKGDYILDNSYDNTKC